MKENKYTISEAARLLSVENHVLRYWEEELELNIPRNELGHRYYREEEIQLLHCIKELKNKGFQLKAVKEVLPDLEQKKLIDIHKLLTTQEELEKYFKFWTKKDWKDEKNYDLILDTAKFSLEECSEILLKRMNE